MPKQQMENLRLAEAANLAAVSQRRDAMVAALNDTPARNLAEQQKLRLAQDDLLASAAEARNGKLASVLAEQQSRLETLQNVRLDLLNKAIDASSQLQNNPSAEPSQA